ncbi:MAG TPA: hypothetical protein VF337_10980 [Candidatus Limnocylindrales bacterium]
MGDPLSPLIGMNLLGSGSIEPRRARVLSVFGSGCEPIDGD